MSKCENNSYSESVVEFNYVLNDVYATLNSSAKTQNDKLLYLRFMINAIGRDIETSTQVRNIYKSIDTAPLGTSVFPQMLFFDERKEKSLFTDEITKIKLQEDIVITEPWRKGTKIMSILSGIDKVGFAYDYRNHKSIYYPYMNITISYCGNHSIACGKFMKTGIIEAYAYDVETAFKHIDTDGEKWIFINCNNEPKPVCNFRYALLYKLAKIYYEMLNGCTL